jgi:hypothetical protein
MLAQGRVDLEALVARIRAEFPDLVFERASLNDFGEDHAVVMLDDAWVFRFPRGAEVVACSERERRLLARAATSILLPSREKVPLRRQGRMRGRAGG